MRPKNLGRLCRGVQKGALTMRKKFAALLALLLISCTFASAAVASVHPVNALIKNSGGSNCTTNCQLVVAVNGASPTITYVSSVTTITEPYWVWNSCCLSNATYQFNAERNVAVDGATVDVWARKPCLGGYLLSVTLRSSLPGSPIDSQPTYFGTLQVGTQCLPAAPVLNAAQALFGT